jgi:glucose/arabinose dehydrogenase
MPTPTSPSRRVSKVVGLVLAALVAVSGAILACVPQYDRPSPRQIVSFWTDPAYTVNAPVAYEMLGIAMGVPEEEELRARFELPEGYRMGVYAAGLSHVRFLHFTSGGHLLASQSMKGRVLLLDPDRDADGRADGARVLFADLTLPHGLEIHAGWLYVAEVDRISRVRLDERTGEVAGELERIATLPATSGHSLRPLEVGPDGWLYTAVGTDCNACIPEGPLEGTILRMRPDGSGLEVHASGFRNVTDLGWHPGTGDLYANEVGRDFLGDTLPPEELNRIEPGGFYGFPYLSGGTLPDPEFGALDPDPGRALPPAHLFDAHATPLGLAFPDGAHVPAELRGRALVALHGSWNRRTKVGYKVVSLRWRDDGGIEQSDFISGFERDEDVVGRPVDVTVGPDGAVYVSDDYAGAVYRIARAP